MSYRNEYQCYYNDENNSIDSINFGKGYSNGIHNDSSSGFGMVHNGSSSNDSSNFERIYLSENEIIREKDAYDYVNVDVSGSESESKNVCYINIDLERHNRQKMREKENDEKDTDTKLNRIYEELKIDFEKTFQIFNIDEADYVEIPENHDIIIDKKKLVSNNSSEFQNSNSQNDCEKLSGSSSSSIKNVMLQCFENKVQENTNSNHKRKPSSCSLSCDVINTHIILSPTTQTKANKRKTYNHEFEIFQPSDYNIINVYDSSENDNNNNVNTRVSKNVNIIDNTAKVDIDNSNTRKRKWSHSVRKSLSNYVNISATRKGDEYNEKNPNINIINNSIENNDYKIRSRSSINTNSFNLLKNETNTNTPKKFGFANILFGVEIKSNSTSDLSQSFSMASTEKKNKLDRHLIY
eukprot:Pgem_evm1s15519